MVSSLAMRMAVLLFGDLVKLERSVGQKSAWIEGYVIGATILVYPGIQLIKTCGDPMMGATLFSRYSA